METYVILRRGGWQTADELEAAAARSTAEGDKVPDDIAWVRSYVLAERDGTVGTVCIYQASSEEAVRRHANAAELPVDEVIKVADTVLVREDPAPAPA
jgi:sporulation protein YlmC with PRC-barrel domain